MAYQILMVCLGNICRSPTAQVVLRHKLGAAGIDGEVYVGSAGTHAARPERADPRAVRHASQRGYDLSHLRAQGLTPAMFASFDLILAMDADNLQVLRSSCPAEHQGKLKLLGAYAVRLTPHFEVPDPYYGGPNSFEHVLDLIEDACNGVVAHVVQTLRSMG